MRVVLSTRGSLALLAALALALVAAMVVSANSAKAQVTKIAICHAVPVAGPSINQYIFLEVDDNATLGGHAGHPKDIILGPAGEYGPEDCPGGGTTTGTDTTGTNTTTTGKDVIITDVVKKVGYTKFEGVKKVVYFNTEKNFYFIIVDEKVVEVEKSVVVFTDVASAALYQYSAPAAAEGELPDTGGSGLLPLGALVLLLGGGTAAFFAVKRGIVG